MRCPTASGKYEIVIDYCAGTLDVPAASLFEPHLAACEECRKLVAAQRSLWSTLDSFEVPVSPDFNRRLYARIEAEEAVHGMLSKWMRAWAARWSLSSWRSIAPAAAGCATVVAALMIQQSMRIPGSHTTTPAGEPQVHAQRIDADQVERALDDLEMLKQLGAASGDKTGSM